MVLLVRHLPVALPVDQFGYLLAAAPAQLYIALVNLHADLHFFSRCRKPALLQVYLVIPPPLAW